MENRKIYIFTSTHTHACHIATKIEIGNGKFVPIGPETGNVVKCFRSLRIDMRMADAEQTRYTCTMQMRM